MLVMTYTYICTYLLRPIHLEFLKTLFVKNTIRIKTTPFEIPTSNVLLKCVKNHLKNLLIITNNKVYYQQKWR